MQGAGCGIKGLNLFGSLLDFLEFRVWDPFWKNLGLGVWVSGVGFKIQADDRKVREQGP